MLNKSFDDETRKNILELTREMRDSWTGFYSGRFLADTAAEKLLRYAYGFPELSIENKFKMVLNSGNYMINTYPFGDPTDQIYSQWLGVYHGRTKKRGLNALFRNAGCYMSKNNTDGTTCKDLIILTDVWSEELEESIVDNFAAPYNNNIIRTLNIFLYTDYGITAVPFFMAFPVHGFIGFTDKKTECDDIIKEIQKYPFEYSYKTFDMFRACDQNAHNDDYYTITLNSDGTGSYIKNSRIEAALNPDRIKNFIKEIINLKEDMNEYKARPMPHLLDAYRDEKILLLGQTFEWFAPEGLFEEELAIIVRNLIGYNVV